MSSERPIIGFLTDFGTDGAAAVCRGVMLGICREAQIVDISHTVRKYAIRDAAFILSFTLPYLPVGVHVAVVDPGVGTERRPVAVRAGRGDLLIGPDNGLLAAAADSIGGTAAARVLEERAFWLPEPSATFHGRDIFSPVAAHLAAGTAAFEQLGPELAPGALLRLPATSASVEADLVHTEVVYVDSFGNLRLAGGRAQLTAAFGDLEDGTTLRFELHHEPDEAFGGHARFARTFGDVPVGVTILYIDSAGGLAMADNQGNLHARLGVGTGARVTLSR